MVKFDLSDIIVEHIRAELPDPRASIGNGRHTDRTITLSGDGSTTEFALTTSDPANSKLLIRAIKSMTIGGVPQSKWADYLIDLKNQQIIFRDWSDSADKPPASGTDNIVIQAVEGTTTWVFSDKPRSDLNAESSFPRISVVEVTADGDRLGNEKGPNAADVEDEILFQIEAWTKENKTMTVDDSVYEGEELAKTLVQSVKDLMRRDTDAVYPALYDYSTVNSGNLPRDEIFQNLHFIFEITLKTLNVGKNR